MTGPPPRRRIAPLVRRRTDTGSAAERLLAALGVDPAFSEALLGDMAEERALRVARDGATAARLWYVREALRAAPHVAWSWLRYSRKHAPERLIVAAGVLAAAPLLVAVVLASRDGPPARFAGAREGGFVVNSRHPVRLPMMALDAAGHVLKRAGVRYRWVSGVPAIVSPDGVVTCTTRGDATVRVSAGPVATEVPVLCRPVKAVIASEYEMSFVVGQPARALGISAVDSAGRLVSQVTGTLAMSDTTVAVLVQRPDGYRVAPRAPGTAFVDIHVGDQRTSVAVEVYAPASTIEGVLENQQRVAVAVRLAKGETREWRLSPGRYEIEMVPDHAEGRVPGLVIFGANCARWGARFTCVAGSDARVIAYREPRGSGPDTVRAFVAVRRAE